MTELEIQEITNDHHVEVVRLLDRLRGTQLSYVDASSLCIPANKRIRTVWSTDHHLAVTGARVLPN